MWTPRRMLLLVLGIGVFFGAYSVYARFLGGIDGLPHLPPELLARRADSDPFLPPTQTVTDRKLALAFGSSCEEISYNYKVELPAKGIIIATNQYDIDPDGRLKLTPFSLATLRERNAGGHPEINSVHCDIGYLEFDKPVKTLQEIGSRRIVACELVGDPELLSHDPRRGAIHLVNNRATPSPDDDLVLVTSGPVTYREAAQPGLPLDKAKPEIATAAAVQIVDRRDAPQSTTVTAQGMQVFLAVDGPGEAGQRRGPVGRSAAITGVRRVVLPANVNMNLWIESGSGFLASSRSEKPPINGDRRTRTNLQITTMGSFTYDMLPDGDRARFDRLPPSATPLPNSVRVVRPLVRSADSVLNDQLECDSLELKFMGKTPPANAVKPAPGRSAAGTDRVQIEWIHAWGQYVILTSDEEKLEARGNDLFHDAVAKTTTLHGHPETVAIRENSEIHAPVLIIHAAEDKAEQYAEARGEGTFRLMDKAGGQRTVTGRWKDRLTYRKDGDRDLLTLSGDAVFDNPSGGQMLRGDTIKLWLTGAARAAPTVPAAGGPAERVRPNKLEAFGHVLAQAPELSIRDTDELIVFFRELEPVMPAASPAPGVATPSAPPFPAPVSPPPQQQKPAQRPREPIDLRARRIQVFLLRAGEQTQLDRVDCEGAVAVHQNPTPPQTKPIDMRGTGLSLKHTPDGNILEVKGDLQSPGEVILPELELIGPYIKIDQVENVAEVNDIGSMRIESHTDMQGKKLDKPTPLIITWKQKMRFKGQTVVFHGHVQAEQGDTSLLCNNMQVFLNKPVSLKQPSPDERRGTEGAAGIDKVICDNQGQTLPQPVSITENVRGLDGKLVRYHRIETDTVAMHKEEGLLEAGPGSVRILQPGGKDDSLLAPSKPREPPSTPRPPADDAYKLTWVRYGRALRVDNQRRTATFHKNVEVLHMPKDDPGLALNFSKLVDALPPGAVYLRCERLDVYSTKDASGRTQQEFTARDRAEVQAAEFSGRASVIKYDDAKQQVVFEGNGGALAELYRVTVPGQPAETIKAEKIIYNRLTGAFKTEGTKMITAGGTKRPQ